MKQLQGFKNTNTQTCHQFFLPGRKKQYGAFSLLHVQDILISATLLYLEGVPTDFLEEAIWRYSAVEVYVLIVRLQECQSRSSSLTCSRSWPLNHFGIGLAKPNGKIKDALLKSSPPP